jgi:hypothetical protein
MLGLGAAFMLLAGPLPCRAQTVIHDSAPPPAAASPAYGARGRPIPDSLRARADTHARPAVPRPDASARPAAAAPAGPPVPKGVCPPDADPVSTDVLLVTFRARTTPAERQATVKAVKGTIVAPDPADPASAYVRVPSEGNEFLLRAIADRLIRAPAVKEVGAVQCSAAQ